MLFAARRPPPHVSKDDMEKGLFLRIYRALAWPRHGSGKSALLHLQVGTIFVKCPFGGRSTPTQRARLSDHQVLFTCYRDRAPATAAGAMRSISTHNIRSQV